MPHREIKKEARLQAASGPHFIFSTAKFNFLFKVLQSLRRTAFAVSGDQLATPVDATTKGSEDSWMVSMSVRILSHSRRTRPLAAK